jgi:hypothetical protein
VQGHPSLGDQELQVLEREFSEELKTPDDGYNAIARDLKITFLETKATLEQFRFVAGVSGATCILFEEPPATWGCYVTSKDAETCTIADTRFRNRIQQAFGTAVNQVSTGYPSWERPKDLRQFLLAVALNLIAAGMAVLVPLVNPYSLLTGILILVLLIPMISLGNWSLRGR